MVTSRAVMFLAIVVALIATASGCSKSKALKTPTDAELKSAGSSSAASASDPTGSMWKESNLPLEKAKKIKKEIEEAFKKDVDIWIHADASSDFADAMVGKAYAELKKQFDDELSQGKIKLRRHDDQKFEVVRVKEYSGIVAYTYIDNGLYVDAKSKKPLGDPVGKKREWLVGMVKTGEGWKISDILPLRPQKGPGH